MLFPYRFYFFVLVSCCFLLFPVIANALACWFVWQKISYTSLCNMKIGRVRHFARLDYFARAMACDANCFLSVVSHTCCQELEAAFKETFCVIN